MTTIDEIAHILARGDERLATFSQWLANELHDAGLIGAPNALATVNDAATLMCGMASEELVAPPLIVARLRAMTITAVECVLVEAPQDREPADPDNDAALRRVAPTPLGAAAIMLEFSRSRHDQALPQPGALIFDWYPNHRTGRAILDVADGVQFWLTFVAGRPQDDIAGLPPKHWSVVGAEMFEAVGDALGPPQPPNDGDGIEAAAPEAPRLAA